MTLNLNDLEHSFGTNHVIKGIDFSIERGEVHALMGMNGAGKSTVLQIIAGIHRPSKGTISIDGQQVKFHSPSDALQHGIAFLSQEVDRGLVPNLTVHENFMMSLWGKERKVIFNRRENRRRVAGVFQQYGIELDVDKLIADCSIYEKQIISIIRAISHDSKYILLDEPTAALDYREAERLQSIVEKLKKEGIGFVFISHRMKEVFAMSDRVTVLRNGKTTLSKKVEETTIDEVVHMMTGDVQVTAKRKQEGREKSDHFFKVTNVKLFEQTAPISCEIHAGEIVVIFGLLGSGKTRFAETLFGARRKYELNDSGTKKVIDSPVRAVNEGIAFIPEERAKQGIWRAYDIRTHLSLSFNGMIAKKKEQSASRKLIDLFAVEPRNPDYEVGSLSGGNQQKVAIAKWFNRNPHFIILDEPMKGVDVSAKETIFQRIEGFADEGAAVLYFTSEPDEAIRIADRILIFSQCEIVEEVNPDHISMEQLLDLAERRKGHAAND